MSQATDYVLSNQSGAAFRAELNSILAAIVSANSGATEPTTTYAFMPWADTSSGILKLRNAANDGWVNIGTMADVGLGLLSRAGGAMTGLLNTAKGADVASATTLPLINDGNYFDVTGTTTITAFASLGVGTWIGLHFDGILTLTHNATDLILPGGANITTAAGDEAIFVEYASGDWRCVSYTRADGTPLVVSGASILGASKNLIITNNSGTPNSQVDIDADEIILKDSSGRAYLAESVNLTANIAASGANGLDTGTEANSTWYYLWVIYNPTTDTVASLISSSSTAPTLPTDYTYKALMGSIYNDSGGNFIKILQHGNRVNSAWQLVTNTIPTASYVSISLAVFVPPIARSVLSSVYGGGNASTTLASAHSPTNTDDVAIFSRWRAGSGSGFSSMLEIEVPIITPQTVYYKRGGTAFSEYEFNSHGWTF